MGNSLATTACDVSPNPIEERKELDLSQPVTHKELCNHLEGSCSSNCLSAFPWDVLDATWMYERLLASCNCLMTVPPELPLRLPHLTHLDLDYNHLSSLPNSIGLFVHLQTLLLRHNSLDKLPSSLVRLPRLRKLDLAYNRLAELPFDIGSAPGLAKLNVSHNKLEKLPVSLGRSETLTVLLAQGNQCKVPPQDVCDSGNSDIIIAFLRHLHESLHDTPNDRTASKDSTNIFPRVRGNDAMSSSLNPHSPKFRYVKTQTQTTHTTSRVRTPLMPPPGATTSSMTEIADKIVGLIYGSVIGDALGLATEFMSPDECRFYYDLDKLTYKNIIRDEHTVHWQKGEWTSNSDQMLLVLNSLLHWAGMVDELDFAQRLVHWKTNGLDGLNESGEYMLSETIHDVLNIEGNVTYTQDPHGAAAELLLRSAARVPNGVSVDYCNGHKNGIGSLNESDGAPFDVIVHCDNGSLPRATILGVPEFHNLKEVASNSVRICLATHADERCVTTSVAVSVLIALILQGKHLIAHEAELENLLAIVSGCALKYLSRKEYIKEFKSYMAMKDYESVQLHEKGKVHYALKPLAATIVALRSQQDFRCALSNVILQGGHGSINGCVAGAVLGCVTGYSRLPKDWVDGLTRRRVDWLNDKINHLLDMMGLP